MWPILLLRLVSIAMMHPPAEISQYCRGYLAFKDSLSKGCVGGKGMFPNGELASSLVREKLWLTHPSSAARLPTYIVRGILSYHCILGVSSEAEFAIVACLYVRCDKDLKFPMVPFESFPVKQLDEPAFPADGVPAIGLTDRPPS